jgi:ABC-type Fe3+ transport system permease subunit
MMNFTLTPSEQTVRALSDDYTWLRRGGLSLYSLSGLQRRYTDSKPLKSLEDFLLWVAVAECWGVPLVSLFNETADSAYELETEAKDGTQA